MDTSLHSGVKSAVSWVDSSTWKPSKVTRDTNISREGLASVFWDVQGILFINYLEKRTINSEYYITLLVGLKKEIARKQPEIIERNSLSVDDNIYTNPWGLSTLVKEFSVTAHIMQSSSKELSTLVADRV